MLDLPVVWLMTWQAAQPTFANTCDPWVTVAAEGELLDVDVVGEPAAEGRTLELLATWSDDEDVVLVEAVVADAGFGAANIRMNAEKLTMSDEKSDAGLPLFVVFVRLVVLSGRLLNWQFGLVSRSFGNASLVTPISTL